MVFFGKLFLKAEMYAENLFTNWVYGSAYCSFNKSSLESAILQR